MDVKTAKAMVEEAKKEPENIDELLIKVQKLGVVMENVRQEQNLDEVLGKIMLSAKTPDEQLKVNEVIKIISLFDQIKLSIHYLNKPIKHEGMLQWKIDGTVAINDFTLPEGAKVEYLSNGQWTIGYLKREKTTGKYAICDDRGQVVVSKINQIPGRVR